MGSRPQRLAELDEELRRQQGVAAQLEEVVVAAHRLDPQDLLPDLGQALLQLSFRSHVRVAQVPRPGVPRQGRGFLDLLPPGRGGGAPAFDPVALALEGVGGERHPAAALAGVKPRPVEAQAGEPELRPGRRAGRRRPAGGRQAARRVGTERRGRRRRAAGRGGERLARADLEQHAVGLGSKLAQAVAEAHGLAQVPRPVGGSVASPAVIQVPVTFET